MPTHITPKSRTVTNDNLVVTEFGRTGHAQQWQPGDLPEEYGDAKDLPSATKWYKANADVKKKAAPKAANKSAV